MVEKNRVIRCDSQGKAVLVIDGDEVYTPINKRKPINVAERSTRPYKQTGFDDMLAQQEVRKRKRTHPVTEQDVEKLARQLIYLGWEPDEGRIIRLREVMMRRVQEPPE